MRDCGNIKFLLLDPQLVEISRYHHWYPFSYWLVFWSLLTPARPTDRQSRLIKSDNFQCFIVSSWQSVIGEHMKTLNLPFVVTTPDSLLHILYIQRYCVLYLHEMFSLCKPTTIDNRWYQSGGLYLILYLPLYLDLHKVSIKGLFKLIRLVK